MAVPGSKHRGTTSVAGLAAGGWWSDAERAKRPVNFTIRPAGYALSPTPSHDGEEEPLKAPLPSPEEEAAEAELEGVAVRKPGELRAVVWGRTSQPEVAVLARKLRQCGPFRDFGQVALMELAACAERREFLAGEVLCKQGETEDWLGFLESGQVTLHADFADGEVEKVSVASLRTNDTFGELAFLGVCGQRASTVRADFEGCAVVLRGPAVWRLLGRHPDELQLLQAEEARWRAFLGSSLVSLCPLEIACQLRRRASLRELRPGHEQLTLGISRELDCDGAVAIVEQGACTADGERRQEGDVLNEDAVLGIEGTVTVGCEDGWCHVALLTRDCFWSLAGLQGQLRDALKQRALSRLPETSAEEAVQRCRVLQYLQGTKHFWPAVNRITNERLCNPGEEIYGTLARSRPYLYYLQHGSAEVLLRGHVVRSLCPGDHCGELELFGVLPEGDHVVRATGFCVLQEMSSQALQQFPFHHMAGRLGDVRRLSKSYTVDSQTVVETMLQLLSTDGTFQGLPAEFLVDLCRRSENRLLLPGEPISSKDSEGSFSCLVLEGEARRIVNGKEVPIKAPRIFGDLGLLHRGTFFEGELVATTPCCVKILHRSLVVEAFQVHPEAKRHFGSQMRKALAKERAQMVAEKSTGQDLTRRPSIINFGDPEKSSVYNLPFFESCGSRFLYLLDLHMEERTFFPDEVVVREGECSREMYIVLAGRLEATLKGKDVGGIGDSECFGEVALLGLVKNRTATVVARSLCDVRVLTPAMFDMILKEVPHEQARFEAMAARRSRLTQAAGDPVQHTMRFFNQCDHRFAKSLLDSMEDKIFVEGAVLMRKGEPGEWMLLVHGGAADVTVDHVKVGEVNKGEIVGEIVAVGLAPVRTATVTATSTVFAQVLRRNPLMRTLSQFPSERQSLRTLAARRLEQHPAPESVAHFSLFRNCPKDFLAYIDRHSRRRIFFSGDTLLREGATGLHLVLLVSGTCQLEQHGQALGEVHGGSVLGELAAMGLMPTRTATLRCSDVCDVRILASSALFAALQMWSEQLDAFKVLAAVRLRMNVEQDTESLLHKSQLFEHCSKRFLNSLSAQCKDTLYMRGETVCYEGERGDSMYILIHGTLQVSIGGVHVSDVGPGSVLGEVVVLGFSSTRTATLTARDVCLVQVLSRDDFTKRLVYFPKEMAYLQHQGAARILNSKVHAEEDRFKTQPLFRDCQPGFLAQLTRLLTRRVAFMGTKIATQGKEYAEMHVVVQGHATAEQDGKHIRDIREGDAFFEMHVLGVTAEALFSVRAASLCQLQLLSRSSLEGLLADYPVERWRVLHVAALTMRDYYADISDAELLSEVQLLRSLPVQLLQRLSQKALVGLALDGEPITDQDDPKVFVLLQGSARVEAGGHRGRLLRAGDFGGELGVLGLDGLGNASVRSRGSSLYLAVSRGALSEAAQDCGEDVQQKVRRLVDELRGEEETAAAFRGLWRGLGLPADLGDQLLPSCEEVAVLPPGRVLSPDQRKEFLAFVLTGQVQVGAGVVRGPGSALAMEALQGLAGPDAVAAAPCRALLLHRDVLLAVLKEQTTEQQSYIVGCLEQGAAGGLRQRAEQLLQTGLEAAQARIAARRKARKANGVVTLACLMPHKQDPKGKTSPRAGGHWARSRRRLLSRTRLARIFTTSLAQAVQKEDDEGGELEPAAPRDEAPTLQQELQASLGRDLERLTAEARKAAEGARGSELLLRVEAGTLRAKLAALGVSVDPLGVELRRPRLLPVMEQPPDDARPVPEGDEGTRRVAAPAQQRVERLEAMVADAVRQRQRLLARLRQEPLQRLPAELS